MVCVRLNIPTDEHAIPMNLSLPGTTSLYKPIRRMTDLYAACLSGCDFNYRGQWLK